MKYLYTALTVMCLVVLFGAADAGAGTEAEGVPTFTKDVAPILFENCLVCHRPGQIAPMSFLSYKEVRPWSRAIKEKVSTREMPPWLAHPDYGEFRNDRSLSQNEIDTIVAWADAGAPKGRDADLPELPVFNDAWVYGSPDAILKMPVEYEIPAEGEGPIPQFYTKIPFAEDRYAVKVEMKPSNVAVVHHANVMFRESLSIPEGAKFVDGQFIKADGTEVSANELRGEISVFNVEAFNENGGQLISYVPGRGFESFDWPGVGKRIPAGHWALWNMHYQPSGRPEKDQTDVGLYFAKEELKHQVVTSFMSGAYIVEGKELIAGSVSQAPDIPVIPAHAENWRIKLMMPVKEDITLWAFQPHAHLRSKDWQYIVTYPDGREEILLYVPKYSFEWQLHYELAEPIKVPAGSRLMAVGGFDNSLNNRSNPAPDKEVYWAEQSWDEMFSAKFEYSVDSHDLPMKGTTQNDQ